MTKERLYHSLRLMLIRTDTGRAEYIKKNHIFGSVGNNCKWGGWLLPLYPQLIRLGNNVNVHKSASILTHDMINLFLRDCYPDVDLGGNETLGPVLIHDNVYISMNAIIMPNVEINSNCIVSAGAIVTSDVPANSIVAGIPAKIVGSFDSYVALKRIFSTNNPVFRNQHLPDEIAKMEWERFENRRHKKNSE